MELFWTIALVIALYAKSVRYHYLPDDVVPRGQYLYNVPESLPPAEFCKRIPPLRVRLWCIANHCLNVAFINVLFGWKAALLFAVQPTAVSAVCWITGNYYAGTAILVLAVYWCIQSFGWLGAIPALAFYTAALNSTLTALGLPFFYLVMGNPIGMTLFIPLAIYLRGDRFSKGLVIRKQMRERNFDKIDFYKFSFMTKIVAEYLIMFWMPLKMGLFRTFGENVTRDEKHYKQECAFNVHFFLSLSACLAVLALGLVTSPMAVIWFFTMIAPHSQFKIYGQSNPCDRYLYIPMIGLCIITAMALPNPLFWMMVGFFAYRSYLYIPAWKNQESLHRNNLDNFPERAMSHSDYAQHVLTTCCEKNINRINEAGYHIQEARRITDQNGQIFEVYLNMAFYLSCLGNFEGALENTKKALEKGREQGVYGKLEKILEGQIKHFEQMVAEKKKNAVVNNNNNPAPVSQNS